MADSSPSFTVNFKPGAAKQLRKIHLKDQRSIVAAIEELAENPRPRGCVMLVDGDGEYRIRVGNYRVVYDINDRVLTILVLQVEHRRQVYARR